MKKLTRAKIAMIAAAASVLTSGMHAIVQAVYGNQIHSPVLVLGFVLGRVLGDVPLAIICFGIVYGLLTVRRVQGD